MANALRHRGPDDEGYLFYNFQNTICAGSNDTQAEAWQSSLNYSPEKQLNEVGSVCMGIAHRRLSVIDLSANAHQPMASYDGRYWIALNGEIYNYPEIKEELLKLGHQFVTQSDTEVLLYAWIEWGKECLKKLNGMWAFVIFDQKKNKLTACRDRFGVKPFYYFQASDYIAFASEQKAFFEIPGFQSGINHQALFEHLITAEIDKRDEGLFAGIKELKPSHLLEIELGSLCLQTEQYYHLSVNEHLSSFSSVHFIEYARQINTLMTKAIDLRLRSDVSVGFCLSGGLDSSALISYSNRIHSQKNLNQLGSTIKAFTAVNHIKGSDETYWASKVVQELKLEWHQAECASDDLAADIEQMVYYQDIPLLSTSTFAQFQVMKLAKESGVTILMDGQGGDELFAGYFPFYVSYLTQLLKSGNLSLFVGELNALKNSQGTRNLYVRCLIKLLIDKYSPSVISASVSKNIRSESRFVRNEFKQNLHALSVSKEYSLKPLNVHLSEFFTGYYLKNLLRWEDRCSMRYSIESRTPFADDIELIEKMFSIPANYKIVNGWSKSLQREASKGILNEEIRLRKDKLGFSTPQHVWLNQISAKLKTYIHEFGDNNQFIDNQKILKNWNSIFNGKSNREADFVWRYVNFLIWKEKFRL